jgi:hypothetical protein
VAADEGTPKESRGKPVDQQVSNLLGYLQGPIKQVQEWVNSGQLQSTIEHLQEQAGRAQEGVERRLRALNEVRQGMQIHMKKQIEAYQRQMEEPGGAADATNQAPISSSQPPPSETAREPAPTSSERTATPRPKAKGQGKKARGKKGSGRKP